MTEIFSIQYQTEDRPKIEYKKKETHIYGETF